MTNEHIKEIYDELAGLFVKVEPEPERGLGYIRERLTFCRAMQDRTAELRLLASRALSEVMEQHLLTQYLQDVGPSPKTKADLNVLEREKQALSMLVKMIGAQAQVLSRTAMDLRLLADITKEQLKRGEIDPKEAEKELIKEVSVSEISPFQPADRPPPQTREGVGIPLTQTVSLDGPLPAQLDTEPMKLPDTRAVSFDDVLNRDDHGQNTSRIF